MKHVTKCRMCESTRLDQFLDLGTTPPADSFLFENQLQEPEKSYPLRVILCEDCGLAQLDSVVSPDVLYCDNYPYESSTTRAGREHWREFATTAAQTLRLRNNDLVVDIGSNVGVLLSMFREQGARVLGVDPAANIAEIARNNGIDTLTAFFNSETARKIVATIGRAAIITATNVFAHIDDLVDLMKAIDCLLDERGAFIVEMPYFGELVNNLEYDTIYHEHLSYVSLKPAVLFFNRFNMEVFDVQQRDIHGGSFRLYVRRKNVSAAPVADIIEQILASEEHNKLHDLARLRTFADAVAENRTELRHLLMTLKQSGKRIVGVSAPAKGMTLLNYCGLGPDVLEFVAEKSKIKIGRYTPGTHIEVVSDEMLVQEAPDYALLLAWNFAGEIMSNLSEYMAKGGKFIIPIPRPRIVG